MKKERKKQDGAILFVVLMIMLLLSILVMMAVNNSKTSTKISLAQAQQIEAFNNAENMLLRVRYALEQVPLPPSVALNGKPNGQDTVIWITKEMATQVNNSPGSSNNIEEPLFAQPKFAWNENYALTCRDLQTWLKRNKSVVDLDCSESFPTEEDKQPLIFIEFITKQQVVGDIDDMRGAYFYRITILGQGFHSGRNIVQGVTGVGYI